MQPSTNRQEEDHQLLCLLKALHVAMKRLSTHVLVTQPQWALFDRMWHAVQHNDVASFEQAIHDLDTATYRHHHTALGPRAASQYWVVRDLIRCVHGVWPSSFQAH